MNMITSGFGRSRHGPHVPGRRADAEPPQAVLARQWSVLHRAAAAVAQIAGQPAPVMTEDLLAFPAKAVLLQGMRRLMVEEGIADLIAVLEPGLTALLAVSRRGGDAMTPANALWAEFVSAQRALIALAHVPPPPASD